MKPLKLGDEPRYFYDVELDEIYELFVKYSEDSIGGYPRPEFLNFLDDLYFIIKPQQLEMLVKNELFIELE